jgi:hypothetical protein
MTWNLTRLFAFLAQLPGCHLPAIVHVFGTSVRTSGNRLQVFALMPVAELDHDVGS